MKAEKRYGAPPKTLMADSMIVTRTRRNDVALLITFGGGLGWVRP